MSEWISVKDRLPDIGQKVIWRGIIHWKRKDKVSYFDDELTNEEEALEYGVTAYLLRKNTDFLVCTHPYVGDLTYEYVTHWTILNDPEQ